MAIRWLTVSLLVGLLAGASAGPARAARFEQISSEVDKEVPASQHGGGSVPSITTSADATAEVATFEATSTQGNDCGAECDGPDCPPVNILCLNQAMQTFQIEPDPGESIGDPVRVCVEHSYEMIATSTAGYSTTVTTGGVPINTATSVTLIPGGVKFSNGPVIITSGNASDGFRQAFFAKIGDTIETRLGTQVVVTGMGIGGGRGVQSARLRVFSCESAPAPLLSPTGIVFLFVVLIGYGVRALRRRRVT